MEKVAVRNKVLFNYTCKAYGLVKPFKNSATSYGPWDRRGIIFASQKLPKVERKVFCTDLKSKNIEFLDKMIIKYVLSLQ